MLDKLKREILSRRDRLAIPLAVFAVAAVVLAVTGAFASPAPAAGTAMPDASSDSSAPATMTSLLVSQYGLLSENTSTSQTPIPSKMEARPGFQEAVQRLGLNVGAARMATASDGTDVWLIPGTSGYSVIVYDPATGSAVRAGGSALPADGFLGFVGQDAGVYVAVGLVPDGNATVGLTSADGTTSTVVVTDNALSASTANPGGFTGITDVDSSGETQTADWTPGLGQG